MKPTRILKHRLSDIRTDGTQVRVARSAKTVRDYVNRMEEGDKFPPLVTFFDLTNRDTYLADGHHRLEAAKQVGLIEIECEYHEALDGRHAARMYAATTANRNHGLRYSNADKRQAVLVLLDDAEAGEWSDRRIADAVGVGHQLVATVRKLKAGDIQLDESSSSPQAPVQARIGSDGKARSKPARSSPSPLAFPEAREPDETVRVELTPSSEPAAVPPQGAISEARAVFDKATAAEREQIRMLWADWLSDAQEAQP